MIRKLLLIAPLLVGLAIPALAQPAGQSVQIQDGSNSALKAKVETNGSVDIQCTSGCSGGGSSSGLNAASSLPTLAPGAQTPQGSLAGAAYVQPAFGTASGGGTQVDATHGLPTDVKVSVLPTGGSTSALQTTGNASLASLVSGIIATESGRVPTNSISGQAGVAGGTGASGANTIRVVPSSDSTTAVTNAGTFAVQNTAATVASENHIGEVGGNMLPITNAMTTTNATTTTGQSAGGLQTLANAVRVSGALGTGGTSGIIQDVLVTFKDAVGAGPLDVYFFNANPSGSTCTNDSAFILADADRTKVIGIAHVTDFTASNTAAVGQAHNLAMTFGVSSATSIFACVVARASFAITGVANAALQVNDLRN